MGPTADVRGENFKNYNTSRISPSIHYMYATDAPCQYLQRCQGMAVIAVPAEGTAQLTSLAGTSGTVVTRRLRR